MGHLGSQGLEKLAATTKEVNFAEQPRPPDACTCDACLTQKGKRRSHNHQIKPGEHPMELVYSDVVGPIPVKGYDGSRFFVTFMCDLTKEAWVYCIKAKGEVTDCFLHYQKQNERLDKGWTIRRLHDDNGGEYIAKRLQQHLFSSGILWEATEPYTPQMNGPAERIGQTLWQKAAPMLNNAGLDLKYWPEAVKHALYLYNRSIHSAIDMSPYRARYGRVPRYSHINTFGSIVYYNNPGQKKKFRDVTTRGILLGYDGDTICRILKPDGRVARGAAIHAIERVLWEKFDPEDVDYPSDIPLDHLSDPTQPAKLTHHQMPISKPLRDPLAVLKRKRRGEVDDDDDGWLLPRSDAPPLAKRTFSTQLPQKALVPRANFPRSSHSPSPNFHLLSRSASPSLQDFGPRRAYSTLSSTPSTSSSPSRDGSPPPLNSRSSSVQFVGARERSRSIESLHSLADRPRDSFYHSPPPRRERISRAAKQGIQYGDELSELPSSPVEPLEDDLDIYDDAPGPIEPFQPSSDDTESDSPLKTPLKRNSEYPSSAAVTPGSDELEYLPRPRFVPESPLPDSEDDELSDIEVQRVELPENLSEILARHPHLEPDLSLVSVTQPDAYNLFLLPSYVAATNELSLLSFLGKADAIEPFEPKTLKQAMESGQWKQWQAAIQDEYDSLVENGTWTTQAVPGHRQALSGKWVFKIKRGHAGQILRYKARWVVRGFEQREGIDYTETFASVVKPMSYKAIFAIAAAMDWELEQMDVKTAFLYGDIEEEVYIDLPTGCKVSGTARLNKALYGLKQSPRVWYNTLATFLASIGFSPLDADSSVFIKDGIILAIYVDDLLIAGESKLDIDTVKAALSKRFKMSDLGPCHFYLGMEVIRDRPRRTLRLSQEAYLYKVLQDFDMLESNPVATPMETSINLLPADPEYQASPKFRRQYQSAVGSLMYAMLGTRPDIAYAVSVVSRFSSNPTERHMNMVKRILKYLKGTIAMGLVYRGQLQPLLGYTDSDWAGDPATRRSTSGYVFNLGSAVVSWSSKRQVTVSLSSCEAEYIGQTNATKEAIWLQRFLKQVQPDTNSMGATLIYGDNQGAIAMANNDVFHGRMKHVEIQHHFVREKISAGVVELRYISTKEQVADGLTKPLCRDKFQAFRKAVGVE